MLGSIVLRRRKILEGFEGLKSLERTEHSLQSDHWLNNISVKFENFVFVRERSTKNFEAQEGQKIRSEGLEGSQRRVQMGQIQMQQMDFQMARFKEVQTSCKMIQSWASGQKMRVEPAVSSALGQKVRDEPDGLQMVGMLQMVSNGSKDPLWVGRAGRSR